MAFQEFTPREYLLIDIATHFGLDQVDWDERIGWANANAHDYANLVRQAKEPALFFAAGRALERADAGEEIGHMIALDATASGIQILSLLTGDLSAAKHCNVVDVGSRQNAYNNVFQLMKEVDDQLQVSPKQSKYALMTCFYGSEAVPKAVFGEGETLELFENIASREMPAVWAFNKAALAMWDAKATYHHWVLPDNFHVHYDIKGKVFHKFSFFGRIKEAVTKTVMAQPKGRSLGANITHSTDGLLVREMVARCCYDPERIAQVRYALKQGCGQGTSSKDDQLLLNLIDRWENSGFLSARILDCIHASNVDLLSPAQKEAVMSMIDSMPAKPFAILTNHDCFRVHPNYGNEVRRQYNILLAKIGASNILSDICGQLLNRPVRLGKLNVIPTQDILETNYALS